jgi:putative addiction module killer protein
VIEVRKTTAFSDWMATLSDHRARAKIAARIDRLAFGNPGDVRPVGEGVSELRIRYGPGYRVYFVKRDSSLFCCYVVAIKAHRPKTSRPQKCLRRT